MEKIMEYFNQSHFDYNKVQVHIYISFEKIDPIAKKKQNNNIFVYFVFFTIIC